MRFKSMSLAVLGAVFFCVSAMAMADKAKPIKALLITGGCCHDYGNQKEILPKGISDRANVEWTVVHEGGSSLKHQISIFKDKDWAKDYDVVVHNQCFANEKDLEHIGNIIAPHKAGVPAVVIHCAAHCYRGDTDEWFKFLGVRSPNHGPQLPINFEVVAPENPIVKNFNPKWVTENEELYNIIEVYPNTVPLVNGYQKDPEKKQVIVWTNQVEKGRVFGTTLAHNNVTFQDPEFLDLVTRGLLWSVGKLDAEGKPLPGYEAVPKAAAEKVEETKVEEGPQPTLADWSEDQAAKLPAGETAVRLFNGKDFTGWEGHTDKYWSIEDGVIVGKNTKENAPKVSTYLLTDKKYKNFSLIFESSYLLMRFQIGITSSHFITFV